MRAGELQHVVGVGQVTYRFFMSHSVTIIASLQAMGVLYSIFLPPVFFWHGTVLEKDQVVFGNTLNLTSTTPLSLLGATGGGNVGDSTAMSFFACLWTFSLAFCYLPETAAPGIRGCFCDVPNYSRDHGAGVDKRTDRQKFLSAKSESVGRPVYKHSVEEANRSYTWARRHLRVGKVCRVMSVCAP